MGRGCGRHLPPLPVGDGKSCASEGWSLRVRRASGDRIGRTETFSRARNDSRWLIGGGMVRRGGDDKRGQIYSRRTTVGKRMVEPNSRVEEHNRGNLISGFPVPAHLTLTHPFHTTSRFHPHFPEKTTGHKDTHPTSRIEPTVLSGLVKPPQPNSSQSANLHIF